MRTIKFRVWNGVEMKQPSVNMLIQSTNGYPFWQFGFSEPDPMPDCIVMQFTGLLDKNGKEIYEGDIIKNERGYLATVVFEVDDCNRGHEPVKGMFGEMVELDGFFTSLSSFTLKYHTKSDSFRIQNTEIIGNIYENKDLLK